jgi:hypothetical protein
MTGKIITRRVSKSWKVITKTSTISGKIPRGTLTPHKGEGDVALRNSLEGEGSEINKNNTHHFAGRDMVQVKYVDPIPGRQRRSSMLTNNLPTLIANN